MKKKYLLFFLILSFPLYTCLLQAMDTDSELIGPIQMGLNKPIHFTDFESSVRDIVNITAVAVIDAIVDKKKAAK